jgi:hypothetical protein
MVSLLQNVTARDFLLSPTEARLLGLGPDRAEMLAEELKVEYFII